MTNQKLSCIAHATLHLLTRQEKKIKAQNILMGLLKPPVKTVTYKTRTNKEYKLHLYSKCY